MEILWINPTQKLTSINLNSKKKFFSLSKHQINSKEWKPISKKSKWSLFRFENLDRLLLESCRQSCSRFDAMNCMANTPRQCRCYPTNGRQVWPVKSVFSITFFLIFLHLYLKRRRRRRRVFCLFLVFFSSNFPSIFLELSKFQPLQLCRWYFWNERLLHLLFRSFCLQPNDLVFYQTEKNKKKGLKGWINLQSFNLIQMVPVNDHQLFQSNHGI